MVWALFPADPLSGEDKHYIFTKGTYKVGRKGCEVIINKDKGVSRIHAEIVVDEMTSLSHMQITSSLFSSVRIRDCSKYGTFINRNVGPKEKVHEFPKKETNLKDGDLVSFGTGNATYRFCFVPLIFYLYCSESFQENHPLQDKASSIGACITYHLSEDCTHVLVDQLLPVKEGLLEAIIAKKPIVLKSWVELLAGKGIAPNLPGWESYAPTLIIEGLSVKVADSRTREICLKGYTCLVESAQMYKFGNKLQCLLELAGAKIIAVEEFCSSSQGLDHGEISGMVCVIPTGSADKFGHFGKLSSLSRVNEVDLLCAVLSGHLDSSMLISPCVVVSSSCSTDETVVADSDVEMETATSVDATANNCGKEIPACLNKEEISMVCLHVSSDDSQTVQSVNDNDGMRRKVEKVDEIETGNCDVLYSQYLISSSALGSAVNKGPINFKRFRKRNIQSGNSFNNLIPFSKYPYKESDHGNDEMIESVKEEKKRKQMEAIAEDLFNSEKSRRRRMAGSLHGLLSRG